MVAAKHPTSGSARASRPLQAIALASLMLSLSTLPASAAGTPIAQAFDVDLLVETFEGGALGPNWTSDDTDPANGTDTWGLSTYRASSGNGSAWAAGSGGRDADASTVILTEGFEGNISANWTTRDENATSGNDTWGPSAARAHSGSTSYWSAAVGFNDDDGTDTNINLSLYDNDMNTTAWRDFTLPSGLPALVSYWYWADTELDYDFFHAYLNVSGTVMPIQVLNGHESTIFGWIHSVYYAPAGTTQLTLRFESDSTEVYEGVYIDDVEVTAFDPATVFADGFEGSFPANWTAGDDDSTSGDDYWNASTARSHSGNGSAWCAQEGYNDWTAAGDNRNLSQYDTDMYSTMWRPVNLTSFTSAVLTSYVWLDSEVGWDFVYTAYYAGNRWRLGNWLYGGLGPQSGWTVLSALVPSNATRVGFVFESDGSVIQEGAYIDDVALFGIRGVVPNEELHAYDAGMNATMVAPVSMGALPSARLNYSYWIDMGSTSDALSVVYRAGGTWYEADVHAGASAGWQVSNVSLPAGTDRVGFRFASAQEGTSEGAYVDDVRVVSTVPDLLCDATASSLTGVEGQTNFTFGSTASGGVGVHTFLWTFGDGSNSVQPSPAHIYSSAGAYNVTLTVRDGWGQVCAPSVLVVVISHDVSAISVGAPELQVIEGASIQFSAVDNAGHALDFDWTVAPAGCGAVSPAAGAATTFTADAAAGGLTCDIEASFAGGGGHATIQVLHDVSRIAVTPAAAVVTEGDSLSLSAVDASGHSLSFNWTTTCGAVTPETGSDTATFTAPLDGAACVVTASFGGRSGSATITVEHDLPNGHVESSAGTVVEGGDVALRFIDGAGHAIEATWSVAPAACGQFVPSVPSQVSFVVDASAGGMTCRIVANVSIGEAAFSLIVFHAMAGSGVSPANATGVEGGSREFTFADAYGHAVDVSWSLDPANCGSLSAATGSGTTVSFDPDAGGSTCFLVATNGTEVWLGGISVDHGPAEAIAVDPQQQMALEGATVAFTATLLDGSGHTRNPNLVAWTTTCGRLSHATGRVTNLTLSAEAGGQDCEVVASFGNLTATATVTADHAPPFAVVLSRTNATVGVGGAVNFTAAARDANGHEMAGATVSWHVSCGAVSPTSGLLVTFTAPEEAGTCTIEASAMVATATAQGATATVTVTEASREGPPTKGVGGEVDMILVSVLVAVAAAAGVALFLWQRYRATGAPPPMEDDRKERAP